MTRTVVPLLLAALFQPVTAPTKPIWLDQPLAGWNNPGRPVPRAPQPKESLKAVIARCSLTPPKGGPAEALASSGWIVFDYFGQPIVRDDVAIVGGLSGADGMCRPTGYNVFVFVSGKYAGTLSPVAMTSREDGSSGEVRISPLEITAEFSRYTPADPLCCPSSRAIVRFRIDRTAPSAAVVPVAIERSVNQ